MSVVRIPFDQYFIYIRDLLRDILTAPAGEDVSVELVSDNGIDVIDITSIPLEGTVEGNYLAVAASAFQYSQWMVTGEHSEWVCHPKEISPGIFGVGMFFKESAEREPRPIATLLVQAANDNVVQVRILAPLIYREVAVILLGAFVDSYTHDRAQARSAPPLTPFLLIFNPTNATSDTDIVNTVRRERKPRNEHDDWARQQLGAGGKEKFIRDEWETRNDKDETRPKRSPATIERTWNRIKEDVRSGRY